jgi:hypothetical protein
VGHGRRAEPGPDSDAVRVVRLREEGDDARAPRVSGWERRRAREWDAMGCEARLGRCCAGNAGRPKQLLGQRG